MGIGLGLDNNVDLGSTKNVEPGTCFICQNHGDRGLNSYYDFFALQNYVPTVFENYTASFEIDKHRIELNMWDTSGEIRLGFKIKQLLGISCYHTTRNIMFYCNKSWCQSRLCTGTVHSCPSWLLTAPMAWLTPCELV